MTALVHAISLQHAGNDTALKPTAAKTAAYSAAMGDLVRVDTSGGAVTVTLPTIADGQRGLVGVRLSAGSTAITVDGYSAETIDGAATATVTTASGVKVFVADGNGAWYTMAGGVGALGGSGTVNTVAASGATQTIPEPSVNLYNDITLTANCTLTLPATTKGKELTIVFRQDGTGGRTVTWPAGTKFPGGSLTITATASAVDLVKVISVVEGTWIAYRVGAAVA